MTRAAIIRRIMQVEQEHAQALKACRTCRGWKSAYIWEEDGIWHPHPPECPDCGRVMPCKAYGGFDASAV